jgi:hypothetical protein
MVSLGAIMLTMRMAMVFIDPSRSYKKQVKYVLIAYCNAFSASTLVPSSSCSDTFFILFWQLAVHKH